METTGRMWTFYILNNCSTIVRHFLCGLELHQRSGGPKDRLGRCKGSWTAGVLLEEKGDGNNLDWPLRPNVCEFGLWVVSQQAKARSTPSTVLVLLHYLFNFSFITPPTLFIWTLLSTFFWFYLISVWTDKDFQTETSRPSVNCYDVCAQTRNSHWIYWCIAMNLTSFIYIYIYTCIYSPTSIIRTSIIRTLRLGSMNKFIFNWWWIIHLI